ncbi:MAG: response regulator [Gemmatimonadetes bacterium]|nr:response regulator [Gemmatimonadota bacterium]
MTGLRRRIAVVEDSPEHRLLARALLEAHYEITEYENGLEALQGLRTARPDLVLLDISLVEMDGLEVLRQIRGDPRLHDLPVIALTGHARVGDREAFLTAGFDGYLAKPIVDREHLLAAIRGSLRKGRDPRSDGGHEAR